jgi:hypothetical protein
MVKTTCRATGPFQFARGVKLPMPSVMTLLDRGREGGRLRCSTASACVYRTALVVGFVRRCHCTFTPYTSAIRAVNILKHWSVFEVPSTSSWRFPELRSLARNTVILC